MKPKNSRVKFTSTAIQRTLCIALALISLASFARAGDGTPAGAFGNKRVLIIGIDGVRSDCQVIASTPHMDALSAAGSITHDAYAGGEKGGATQQETSSCPGWLSILTGVWADKHGVSVNNFSGYNSAAYPHVFKRIAEANPSAALASIVQWGPIDTSIVGPVAAFTTHRAIAASEQAVADQAVAYLGANDPDVLFLHLDDVDHAGHSSGFNANSAYLNAISAADRHVGEVIAALHARPNYASEDWLVIVVTDHGGIGTSHGSQDDEVRTIFMIANGGSIPAQVISPGPGQTAVPPTVLTHLGIPVNAAWGWESETFGLPQSCLNSVTCNVDQSAKTVTLAWNAPAPTLNATGIRIERDNIQIAELPLTATGYVDSPSIPSGGGVHEFVYTIHTYGGTEGDTCPVRSCTAELHEGLKATGLVGYYSFDSDSAADRSKSVDGSSSANHGSWTGTATYKDGTFGRAAVIGNGAGSNFITASGAEYNFGATGSFTVVYWANFTANVAGDPVIIAGGGKNWSGSGKTRGWVSAIKVNTGDDITSNISDGSARSDTASIDFDPDSYWNDGREHWTFVAMVVDRSAQTLTSYVVDDNVPATNPIRSANVAGRDFGPDASAPAFTGIANVGNITAGNLNIVMGQDGDGAGYSLPATGLDDLSIWSRPLTTNELWQIYAEGRANNKSLRAVLGAYLNSVTCDVDETAKTVALGWDAPGPTLDATGIRIERDNIQIAELPLTATGYIDSPPRPTGGGVHEFVYTIHTYGGTEGDYAPVRSCTARLAYKINATGLISYYSFDSDSIADRSMAVGGSSSFNNGSWTGTATYKDGAFGRAAVIGNGAGSNFITVNGAEYDFGATGSFTVVYWINIKANVASDPVIIAGGGKNWGKANGGLTRGWASVLSNGDDIRNNIGDGSARSDTDFIDLDPDAGWNDGREHWNFVAMVVDRSAQTLTSYVADGLVPATNPIWSSGLSGRDFGPDASTPSVKNTSNVGDITAGNLNIVMGQDGDGAGYSLPATGIDDISIWNRPLNTSQIWQIYAEGRANSKSLSTIIGLPLLGTALIIL